MGNRDGATRGDLAEKNGNHAATAAHNVSEPYTGKLRVVTITLVLVRVLLNHQLCRPLGRSHDTRWINCLVSGNHDQAFAAKFNGRVRKFACPDNIVQHRFTAVSLHYGNMLISCGMEDNLRATKLKCSTNCFMVANVTHNRQYLFAVQRFNQFEDRILVVIEYRNAVNLQCRDLSRYLRTYGPASSSN